MPQFGKFNSTMSRIEETKRDCYEGHFLYRLTASLPALSVPGDSAYFRHFENSNAKSDFGYVYHCMDSNLSLRQLNSLPAMHASDRELLFLNHYAVTTDFKRK